MLFWQDKATAAYKSVRALHVQHIRVAIDKSNTTAAIARVTAADEKIDIIRLTIYISIDI